MPATKQVNMKMIHGLSAISAGVDDRAIAVVQMQSARQLSSYSVQVADKDVVGLSCLRQRGDMPSRNDQHMRRRLRVDVSKGNRLVILKQKLRRNDA